MAKKKTNKTLAFICGFLCFVIGACAGIFIKTYVLNDNYYIPETETASSNIATGDINVEEIKNEELSIHFLELGNKYTGDCTFIKVGNTEILIDAGSRASSVTPIYEYVSDYITDNTLEYVIVTHAHQDHYAGFATNKWEDSLFYKLNCETIITFSNTNQKASAKMYSNFVTNLENAETIKNSKVVDALECYENKNGGQREYVLENNVCLVILSHKFYAEGAKSTSENDYSVCCMINQNDEKFYLFTGDLEETGEKSLVDEYKAENGVDLPKVELYKAGHHGSKTSSSDYMLNIIKPKVVCVCCCAGSSEYTSNNANQFPTQAFIDRIALHTKYVYVTTLCIDYNKGTFESFNGNIVVTSSSGEVGTNVLCANNTTLLKDTTWFKSNRKMPQAWSA